MTPVSIQGTAVVSPLPPPSARICLKVSVPHVLYLTCPGKSSEGHLTSPWSGSPNSTRRGHLLPLEPGIRNPTVCLQVNDTLAFLVTREHYPEYDL